jgi:hypothetical protein
MMLAGLPVPVDAVEELAGLVRAAGADDLADRLDRAVADEVKLSRHARRARRHARGARGSAFESRWR